MTTQSKKLLWLTAFAVAMGFLEAIVVVYIRDLYYPEGFRFPLTLLPEKIYLTEILREFCTLVMLLAVGYLGASSRFSRFTCFLFIFGIWDICYYLALKLLLDWPASLLTWDVLFLIPVTWIGPVLAPVLLSLAMIILHLLTLWSSKKKFITHFIMREWLLILAGVLLVYISFTLDYTLLLLRHLQDSPAGNVFRTEEFVKAALDYVPSHFAWECFIPGLSLILASMVSFYLRKESAALNSSAQ